MSASKLLEISVTVNQSEEQKPSHFSAYAPQVFCCCFFDWKITDVLVMQHEGVFFVGNASLAPEGSLRKSFALEISYR